MKAFRMHGLGHAVLEDIPIPRPGPGELLVAPIISGVCATDTHLLHDGVNVRSLPVTMGHESVGEVLTVGDPPSEGGPYGAAPSVGALVTVDPILPCGRCSVCHRGQPNLCPDMIHLGLSRDGVYAERFVVPSSRAFPLSLDFDPSLAIFVEPLACAVHAVELAALRTSDHVAVVGAGPYGLLITAAARAAGASRLVVFDPDPRRRELALTMGAREAATDLAAARETFDVVFEAAGAGISVQTALDLAAPGATVVVGGVCGQASVTISTNTIVLKGLRVVGAVSHAWRFAASQELLASGRVDPAPIASHILSLDQANEALELSRTAASCKVLLQH
jgi:threonine dehydrogenase-like Zn-dependent dehydrogenase